MDQLQQREFLRLRFANTCRRITTCSSDRDGHLGAYATIFMIFKLKPYKEKEEVVICMWCCVAVVMMPLHSLPCVSLLLLRCRPAPAHQLPSPSSHYLTRTSKSGPNCRATSRSGKRVSRLLAIKLLRRRMLDKNLSLSPA
ncbi:hypothetical protein PsorP6_003819 [Peronosclerospora sorghi]|uniref:Uncharacterized protein n=1 Tax=Peronosclerospora sorghi TaxID=230839 RepID=A0ACC0VIN3_9STRA|nr:hypothetical protein PsorP6_003819 [Peronosclerospora sorghi]